jgi:hypothetical protein
MVPSTDDGQSRIKVFNIPRQRPHNRTHRAFRAHPPSHRNFFVHPSSHENGVVSTTTPPFLTIDGSRSKNARGSLRRHSRLAARTASTGARLGGRLVASATLKRVRAVSAPVGSRAVRCSCMGHWYSALPGGCLGAGGHRGCSGLSFARSAAASLKHSQQVTRCAGALTDRRVLNHTLNGR